MKKSSTIICPHCGRSVRIPMTFAEGGRRGGAKSKGGGRPRLYKTEAERAQARLSQNRRRSSKQQFYEQMSKLADTPVAIEIKGKRKRKSKTKENKDE